MKYKDYEIIPAFSEKEQLLELFSEYTQYLIDNDPVFASYLELQSYDEELRNLEHKYGPPGGRLYIALDKNGRAAGCIGLKRTDDISCELKRMYVRPEHRGQGLAFFLGQLILDEAKKEGYEYILLDTLSFLTSAQRLYRRLGFYEIPKYNDSPMSDATYMRFDLR